MKIHALEDGRFGLDGGAMFGIIPRPLWSKKHPPDERNRVDMALRCLLIEDGGRLILVDSGIGDQFGEKEADIYWVRREGGDLIKQMNALGFQAGDVTHVIQTHLHFDHAGSATRRDESGRVVPAFPNAQYYVQRSHWDWALAPSARDAGSFRSDNYIPLAEAGVLNFIEGEAEILPGFRAFPVNGHTTSLQVVVFDCNGRTTAFVADLIPFMAHLHLPWVMAYDIRPLETIREKEELLARAVAGQWAVVFQHDVFNEAAIVTRNDKGHFAPGEVLKVADLNR